MSYWARIKGKDYPIANGFTVSDEFSETLDSASIIIPHVYDLLDVKPYDDVIIHDFLPNKTPEDGGLPNRPYGVMVDSNVYMNGNEDVTETASGTPEFAGHFYRHLVVSSVRREQVNLADVRERESDGKTYKTYIHNYYVELASETKGLETVLLPNKTITQPKGTDEDAVEMALSDARFSFPIGAQFATKSTIPYSTVKDFGDGFLIKDADGLFQSRLFAGNVDYARRGSQVIDQRRPRLAIDSSDDFCNFTSMSSYVVSGQNFVLPDWNVSAVSLATYGQGNFVDVKEFHPNKKWLIVKLDSGNESQWTDRSEILRRIKDYYDNGTDYQGVANVEFCGKREITSDKPTYSIVGSLSASSGTKVRVFLYVDAEVQTIPAWYQGDSPISVNVFGMSDNSNGTSIPDENSEFLAYWDATVVSDDSSIIMTSKGVLSVYEAVRQAIDLYSPYEKYTEDGTTWEYKRKYTISSEFRSKFQSVIAPENQWNFPNMRDFITRLTYVCDCIPVVRDGVITYMDLGHRKPIPFDESKGSLSYSENSMDGGSYTDRLLRVYTDGLSRENTVKCVERIGFKNTNSPTLTLENLQLELDHPIYRINKVYLCYYVKFMRESAPDRMALLRHDITPLVLLNAQRNLLSEDYYEMENALKPMPTTIEQLAKYKFATVGYDIGSRTITGWGAKYVVPDKGFWKNTKTMLENLYNFVHRMDTLNLNAFKNEIDPSLELSPDDLDDSTSSPIRYTLVVDGNGDVQEDQYVEVNADAETVGAAYQGMLTGITQKLKSLTFIVEYESYISASVMASKDIHDGNVVTRDNASSSLSFVESDGINQKEKANRLGNATINVTGRYKSISDVQPLACVWDTPETEYDVKEHDDEVLYKRSVTVYEDYVTASYYFCRNYVLRNYFTSVYSRHRAFPLASYEESVERLENKTLEILLSPDSCYHQNESNQLRMNESEIPGILSFYKENGYDVAGQVSQGPAFDTSYYVVWPSENFSYAGQCGVFGAENMVFVSGYSLCFGISMKDNVSAGVFVANFNKNLSAYLGEVWQSGASLGGGTYDLRPSDVLNTNLLTGAKQDWLMFPVDPNTGMLYSMTFGVGKRTEDNSGVTRVVPYDRYNIFTAQLLPLMDVTFIDQDGDHYFGQLNNSVNRMAIGAGYPRISFRKVDSHAFDGNDYYYADMTRANEPHSYQEWVVPYTPEGFIDPDGNEVGEKDIVTEFASACFRGSEIEGAPEKPTCVFKDGKERITTTLQLEPVSEDVRIQFSGLMMGLSDLMGDKAKTYSSGTIQGLSSFMMLGESCCIARKYSQYNCATYHVPMVSFCMPSGTAATASYPIEVDHQFFRTSSPGGMYWLDVSSIDAYGSDSRGAYIIISCVSHFVRRQGVTVDSGQKQIKCYLATPSTVVYGASLSDAGSAPKASNFGYDQTIRPTVYEGLYDVFVFAEDRYFLYDSQYKQGYYQYDNGNGRWDADVTVNQVNGSGENSFMQTYIFDPQSGQYDPLPTPQNTPYYINVGGLNGTKSVSLTNADASVYYVPTEEERTEENTLSAPELPKTGKDYYRRMFWGLFPLMDMETKFQKATNIDGDAVVFGEGEFSEANVSISQNYGRWEMDVTLPEELNGTRSLRLYYRDGREYRFVFGLNLDCEANRGKNKNCIYPEEDGKTYKIYISLLDSRSRTVIDANTGDPTYMVVNFADPEYSATTADNLCVAKGN